MEKLTVALIFIMTVNVFIYFMQVAILDINPEAPHFYNDQGTLLKEFEANDGNGTRVLDTAGIANKLPVGEGSISPTTGNIFTDIFSISKNWMLSLPGVSYVYNMIAAPYNLLKMLNLPNEFVYGIGSLWYAVTLFLIIGWLMGRS